MGFTVTDSEGAITHKPGIIVDIDKDNVADLSVFDAGIKGSEAVTRVPLGNEDTPRTYWVLEG